MGDVIKCTDFEKINNGEISLADVRKKQDISTIDASALRKHLERKLQAKACAVQKAARAVEKAPIFTPVNTQVQAKVQELHKSVAAVQNNNGQPSEAIVFRSVEDIKTKIGNITNLLEDVRRVQTLYTPVEYPVKDIKEAILNIGKQQLTVKDSVNRVQLDVGQIRADVATLANLFAEYEEAFAQYAQTENTIDFSVIVEAVKQSTDNLAHLMKSHKSDEALRINERFSVLEKGIINSVQLVIQDQIVSMQNNLTTILATNSVPVIQERLVVDEEQLKQHIAVESALQEKTLALSTQNEILQNQLSETQASLTKNEVQVEKLQRLVNNYSRTDTQQDELIIQLRSENQVLVAELTKTQNENIQNEQQQVLVIAGLKNEKQELAEQLAQAQKTIADLVLAHGQQDLNNAKLTEDLAKSATEKLELLSKLTQEQQTVVELDDLVAQRSQALVQLEKQKQVLQTQLVNVSRERDQLFQSFETFKQEAQTSVAESIRQEQAIAQEKLINLQRELAEANDQNKGMYEAIAALTNEKQQALVKAQEFSMLYAQEEARAEKIRQYALKVSEYVKQLKEYIKVIQDENNQYRLKLTIFEKRSEAKNQVEQISSLDEDFIPVVRSRAMGTFTREKVA